MAYSNYKVSLIIRVFVLSLVIFVFIFGIFNLNFDGDFLKSMVISILLLVIVLLSIRDIIKFATRRYLEMDRFFMSIKYRDFTQWFNEDSGPKDIRRLHEGFNSINRTILEINKEKEVQYLYLQKILELINTGIIAFNIDSGDVLWVNDSFKDILNIPTIKNIKFIGKRNRKLFEDVIEADHKKGNMINLYSNSDKTKVLISNSSFIVKGEKFKLVVLQNIENTLNQNQLESWNKLLRVLTHEIMNSIAPISSLAETLHAKIHSFITNPNDNNVDINDLLLGIDSIRNRSEGLMKFANTYRGLNKIANLNLNKSSVHKLFKGISNLLEPSLNNKNIELHFKLENPNFRIEMDSSLIEQVLINLILNAVEACKNLERPLIIVSAEKNVDGIAIITVSDNGTGIPNEILDKVFIPFFSTKKTGSGIGLSLCQQIMFLHKGEIKINTIENSGTIIRLIF